MKHMNLVKYTSAFLTTALTSASVFAADYSADIAAASTDANANQGLVITAVIALAVIGFGATAIVAWMRK